MMALVTMRTAMNKTKLFAWLTRNPNRNNYQSYVNRWIEPLKELPVLTDGKGYIYMLADEGFDHMEYKIGMTKNPYDRIRSYNSMRARPLRYMWLQCVKDYSQAEQLLHDYFSCYNIHHEWFELLGEDVRRIINSELLEELSIEKVSPITEYKGALFFHYLEEYYQASYQ